MKRGLLWFASIAVLFSLVGCDHTDENATAPTDKPAGGNQISHDSTKQGSTPINPSLNSKLIDAVLHGKTAEVKKLLDRGADPNARDSDPKIGRTAFMWACQYGGTTPDFDHSSYPAIALMLLDKGADPNATDKNKTTVMNLAAEGDDSAGTGTLVQALMNKGARVTEEDIATAESHRDMVGTDEVVEILKGIRKYRDR